MINANATATATGADPSASAKPKAAGSNLGKDDFLRLLTTQLQHQDPMNPQDDMGFIGQMAQFSALEQTTNMASSLERYGTSQQVAQSIGLIGHEVDAEDASGAKLTGKVDSVNIAAGSIVINVGSNKLSPGQILEIR